MTIYTMRQRRELADRQDAARQEREDAVRLASPDARWWAETYGSDDWDALEARREARGRIIGTP